ncbi:hypothetical protein GCM10028857_08980 [Salinarchaeum chitinilyticum]
MAVGGSLAGCVSFSTGRTPRDASLDLRTVSDRELAESVYDPYDVPGEILDDALAADRAMTTAPAAYPEGSVERHDDGSYYVLDVQPSGPTWIEYAIGFEPSSDGETVGDPTPIAELPAIDQAVVDDAFDINSEAASGESSDGESSFAVSTTRIYDETDRTRSTFVGGDDAAISQQGSIYRVHTERTHVIPGIATIAAEQVAADAERFGGYLRSERAVPLTDLSTAEREVVEAAIDGEYETGTDDSGFAALYQRLDAEWQLDDRSDTLVVQFEGETYFAAIDGLEHYGSEQR